MGLQVHILQNWPPILDFWWLLGVIHNPFFFEIWGIPVQEMTLTVCILTPQYFLSLADSGVIYDPDFKT